MSLKKDWAKIQLIKYLQSRNINTIDKTADLILSLLSSQDSRIHIAVEISDTRPVAAEILGVSERSLYRKKHRNVKRKYGKA